uniref:Membrane-spanning 4-domains subfamily A member 4A n=1 Tax=Neogobius melanostomus TaxID=47308 RepID=A0A8C6TL75_9GOBI
MAEAALAEAGEGSSPSPLLSVSFQKNEQRKLKFLEGEPKALGITQICISIFHMSCIASLFASDMSGGLEIPSFISSMLVVVAGGLAIAAKNLHLPMLRACLGMEIVASVASIFNLIVTLINMSHFRYHYWRYYYENDDSVQRQNYRKIEAAHVHLYSELAVIQAALFAIAVTVAVYAGKVAHCCVSTPKVPVITIQAPPAPQ